MSATITVLTGRRPGYLAQTLDALGAALGQTRDTAHVVCLVNGADPPSLAVAQRHRWVDEIVAQPQFRSIGSNVSRLTQIASGSGRRFWMHLEDDWLADKDAPAGWLDSATDILARERGVGQVRLRRACETVSRSNLVTHRLIVWKPKPHHRRSGVLRYRVAEAHATYNPTVMRVIDAERWMPAENEPATMRKFSAAGMLAAQVYPGVFRHIGEDSLRSKTGG